MTKSLYLWILRDYSAWSALPLDSPHNTQPNSWLRSWACGKTWMCTPSVTTKYLQAFHLDRKLQVGTALELWPLNNSTGTPEYTLRHPAGFYLGSYHSDIINWRVMVTCWVLAMWWILLCNNYAHMIQSMQEGNSGLLGGLSNKKIQRYKNSAQYVTPRWWPRQIPSLNSLAYSLLV